MPSVQPASTQQVTEKGGSVIEIRDTEFFALANMLWAYKNQQEPIEHNIDDEYFSFRGRTLTLEAAQVGSGDDVPGEVPTENDQALRKLPNRVAELFARRKIEAPKEVTATAFVRRSEVSDELDQSAQDSSGLLGRGPTLYIAKNGGCSTKDQNGHVSDVRLAARLQHWLSSILCAPGRSDPSEEFWQLLIQYSRSGIREYMKILGPAKVDVIKTLVASNDPGWSDMVQQVTDLGKKCSKQIERHDEGATHGILLQAYKLRYLAFNSDTKVTKLRDAICCLGLYRAAYEHLQDTASSIGPAEGFDKLRIICLENQRRRLSMWGRFAPRLQASHPGGVCIQASRQLLTDSPWHGPTQDRSAFTPKCSCSSNWRLNCQSRPNRCCTLAAASVHAGYAAISFYSTAVGLLMSIIMVPVGAMVKSIPCGT